MQRGEILFSYYRNGEEVVIKIFPKHESSLQLKNTEKALHGKHAYLLGISTACLRVNVFAYLCMIHSIYIVCAFPSYVFVDLLVKLHGVPNALPFLKFWVSHVNLLRMTKHTSGYVCCFQEAEKAAFLIRQYCRYSLYDRLRFVCDVYVYMCVCMYMCVCAHRFCVHIYLLYSTRPFLNMMQKKWIAFQLLKVLHECHNKKVRT